MYLEIGLIFLVIIAFVIWKLYSKPTKNKDKSKKDNNKPISKELPNPKKKNVSTKVYVADNRIEVQKIMVEFAEKSGGNNIVTRHQQKTAVDLDNFDRHTPLSKQSYRFRGNKAWSCYGCGRPVQNPHPVYIFSCRKCGTKFEKRRNFTRDLHGHISLVIGCRTKLGHQVTLKLLRAGSVVVGTTRFPEKAGPLFESYEDFNEWGPNFDIYEK